MYKYLMASGTTEIHKSYILDGLVCGRLQNSLFFLSFFCCSVLEISMRDAGMCDARIKGSHTKREFLASLSSPSHNFHARSRSFMIRFQPKRHTLKYGLFCSLGLWYCCIYILLYRCVFYRSNFRDIKLIEM